MYLSNPPRGSAGRHQFPRHIGTEPGRASGLSWELLMLRNDGLLSVVMARTVTVGLNLHLLPTLEPQLLNSKLALPCVELDVSNPKPATT
jgi:hypothetical protein